MIVCGELSSWCMSKTWQVWGCLPPKTMFTSRTSCQHLLHLADLIFQRRFLKLKTTREHFSRGLNGICVWFLYCFGRLFFPSWPLVLCIASLTSSTLVQAVALKVIKFHSFSNPTTRQMMLVMMSSTNLLWKGLGKQKSPLWNNNPLKSLKTL